MRSRLPLIVALFLSAVSGAVHAEESEIVVNCQITERISADGAAQEDVVRSNKTFRFYKKEFDGMELFHDERTGGPTIPPSAWRSEKKWQWFVDVNERLWAGPSIYRRVQIQKDGMINFRLADVLVNSDFLSVQNISRHPTDWGIKDGFGGEFYTLSINRNTGVLSGIWFMGSSTFSLTKFTGICKRKI